MSDLTEAGAYNAECPLSSVAALSATIALAFVSFGIFVRAPKNLFLAAMAFVNATTRLPEAVTLLFQYVIRQKTKLLSDESIVLKLLIFKDPAGETVLICFYVLCLFFFTVIIIHDTKRVPWKWLIALALFVALGPFQEYLLRFIAPFFG